MFVVLRSGDRRHDGDAAVGEERLDGARVDGRDLPDAADVDGLSVDEGLVPGGGEGAGVLAGEADRERAVPVEQPDEFALDPAGEDHPYDVHRLGRGDPQAGPELAGQAVPVEGGADLGAAAVHDDGLQAGAPEEDDVLGEGRLQVVVDHGVAAELDDDRPAVVAGEPGQRLDEDPRLRQRGVPAGAHEL